MRIPSSFHSTEARSKLATASATLSAVEASIGRIGRKSSKPTSRSPSSPSVIAISAVRVRSPESISARRASSPETPAALTIASTISPASAPCRSSPVKSRLTKSASGCVARPSSSPRICLRLAADPLPFAAWISATARSRSATVREGSAAGGGLDAVDRRVADADPPLAGNAGEKRRRRSAPRPARACAGARRGSRPCSSASSCPRPFEAATRSASRVIARRMVPVSSRLCARPARHDRHSG